MGGTLCTKCAATDARIAQLEGALASALSCIDQIPYPEEDWAWHNEDDPKMEKWLAMIAVARRVLEKRLG